MGGAAKFIRWFKGLWDYAFIVPTAHRINNEKGIIPPDFSQGFREIAHSALANSIMVIAELLFLNTPVKSRGNYFTWHLASDVWHRTSDHVELYITLYFILQKHISLIIN